MFGQYVTIWTVTLRLLLIHQQFCRNFIKANDTATVDQAALLPEENYLNCYLLTSRDRHNTPLSSGEEIIAHALCALRQWHLPVRGQKAAGVERTVELGKVGGTECGMWVVRVDAVDGRRGLKRVVIMAQVVHPKSTYVTTIGTCPRVPARKPNDCVTQWWLSRARNTEPLGFDCRIMFSLLGARITHFSFLLHYFILFRNCSCWRLKRSKTNSGHAHAWAARHVAMETYRYW